MGVLGGFWGVQKDPPKPPVFDPLLGGVFGGVKTRVLDPPSDLTQWSLSLTTVGVEDHECHVRSSGVMIFSHDCV